MFIMFFFFCLILVSAFTSLIVELLPNLGSYIGYSTQVFSYVYAFLVVDYSSLSLPFTECKSVSLFMIPSTKTWQELSSRFD